MAEYHPGLVALSILIAVLASYTALDLANSVPARGKSRAVWLAAGSLAMGIGIWSMHFTGMLAFRLNGRPIAYQVDLLVLSVVVAVAASAIALYTITLSARLLPLIVAGFAMGAAIAGMHYIGMAGMRTSASIQWNRVLVGASIVIAIVASFGALTLALRVRHATGTRAFLLKIGGGVVMGIAIAGMHYTGMAAATFVPLAEIAPFPQEYLIATSGLGLAVVISTIVILALAIGGSVIAREMGSRAALAQDLARSEEYYRALIEHSSDLLSVVDANGSFTFVSPAYRNILGFDPAKLLGTPALELAHPDDREAAANAMAKIIEGPRGTIVQLEFRFAHADGSWRTVNGFGQNLLDDPAVHGIVFSATDETERRRLELQFQQSQKMEAVGKLAGGIAHDFNNLLTVILGNAQILMANETAQGDGELIEIRDAAERAAALTRQLLAFSRRQVLQPHVLDLNAIIGGIRQMLTRLLGEHITIRMDLEPGLWQVSADPGQVEQALINLAVNARDAMPAGGVLTFRTRNVHADEEVVASHDIVPKGEYVCLAVDDTGTGMDGATLARVFEPFFTTKEIGKGTGLGLPTVYGIMKQSGGYISVKTELTKGTTFSLFFPRVMDGLLSTEKDRASTTDTHGRETILVVEDEEAVRALVLKILANKGYTVLDGKSGEDALRIAHDHDGPIHLLLTDVVLPDVNGREVANRITMVRPGICVIFMSGYTEDEILHRGVFSDGINFLNKPFDPATLLKRVRAALE